MDLFTRFLKDCCEINPNVSAKSGEFYTAYRMWCRAHGEFAQSTTEFYGAMKMSGFKRKRVATGSFIHGVRLKTSAEGDAHDDFLE